MHARLSARHLVEGAVTGGVAIAARSFENTPFQRSASGVGVSSTPDSAWSRPRTRAGGAHDTLASKLIVSSAARTVQAVPFQVAASDLHFGHRRSCRSSTKSTSGPICTIRRPGRRGEGNRPGWWSSSAHLVPFQRSASIPPPVCPTAMHLAADVHDTPVRRLSSAPGLWRGFTHAFPFQRSVSGFPWLVHRPRCTLWPTCTTRPSASHRQGRTGQSIWCRSMPSPAWPRTGHCGCPPRRCRPWPPGRTPRRAHPGWPPRSCWPAPTAPEPAYQAKPDQCC